MKEFTVYLGVVNYTITLDSSNKIERFRFANRTGQSRNNQINSINCDELKAVLKCLLIANPEQFKELYILLKDNDPEMFAHAKEVVDSIGKHCLTLTALAEE